MEKKEDDRASKEGDLGLGKEDLVTTEHPVLGEATALSLNFVINFSSPKTMKLQGRIGKQTIVVLIDY